MTNAFKQGSESDHTKTEAHRTRIEPGTSVSGRENLRASCACGWQGQKTFQRWRAEREAKTHHAPKTDASLEKQENQALQRAIESLGAREVAPGRYAIKRDDGWIVIREQGCFCGSGLGLREQLERFDGFQPSEIFLGAVLSHAIEMPAWWSPDRQTAYRIVNGDGSYSSERFSNESEAGRLAFGEQLQRITCDLTTGEEIPSAVRGIELMEHVRGDLPEEGVEAATETLCGLVHFGKDWDGEDPRYIAERILTEYFDSLYVSAIRGTL